VTDALVLSCAVELAHIAHEGQFDKIGAPYISHPERVAAGVAADGLGADVQSVAWLHDVVEDTWVTLDDLRWMGFSERIVDAVDAISKRKGEKFADYYERVKANPMALAVKWHDVADNASPERLAKVAPDTRERLRAKYERAVELLSGEAS
jgi:(p)ppGpp synthase/HD superfamily hydrolase